MNVLFDRGDPVWVSLHGGQRRAVFLRYDGGTRIKVQMRSGLVRTFKRAEVTFRFEKEE
jgi:hypothetical protein